MRRLIEFRENGSDLMGDGVNIAMRIIGGPSRGSSRPLSQCLRPTKIGTSAP
jgi:hypothetical protein